LTYALGLHYYGYMPYRESRFTATKYVSKQHEWFVHCTVHGDFENDTGRCLMCDDASAYPDNGFPDIDITEYD